MSMTVSNIIPSAHNRALKVLLESKYFVLSTNDKLGPWAAALGFRPLAPCNLYFISQQKSRHSQAIDQNEDVAGVFYNSQASAADAESIQFSGKAYRVVDIAELENVYPEMDSSEISLLLNNNSIKSAYCVNIIEAFVLDQNLYREKGIDGREFVDIKAVFEEYIPQRNKLKKMWRNN